MTPQVVVGQSAPGDWRVRFAAGEEARQAGRIDDYASEMAAAAQAIPPDHGNRPFVQYHAARAAALAGEPDRAVEWLRRAWDEDIEALMISFAEFDPAFEELEDDPAYLEVMHRAEAMELEVTPLAGAAYMITGTGSNVVAHVGDEGVLLVDVGYRPALPALMAAIGSLGAEGVDRVVITHPHEDHMGAAAGLDAEVVVMAHPGTAEAMADEYVFMEGVTMPPKPANALPDVEIGSDTTFRFNGERVRVLPTVAHTAGDLTVYFPDSRVAAFGDTYLGGNPMMFPGQAEPVAFLDAMESLVDSMDPETVVVGGHDAPVGLAEVRAQIAESRACIALTDRAIEDGLTLEQAVERGAHRFPPQWVSFFYRLRSEQRR